jgi:hypothetical protein
VGSGGAGVENSGATTTLSNSGTIRGGKGGASLSGGFGGSGVSNSDTIKTLSNSGKMSGGDGGGLTTFVNIGGTAARAS